VARRHTLDRVLSFDMGGTTAKICLIRDFTPKTARVFEVARSYRFKKGSGMPISIPVIDMVEIGAGGGSLAHVDSLRQIRVGPESAGSEPGPAAYGRGGHASRCLRRRPPPRPPRPRQLRGRHHPPPPRPFRGRSARRGWPAPQHGPRPAAFGVSEVVDENMANAARVHAVENGEDLADYTMIAFGGAAPLHAGRLCEKLGISRLLVPPGAGVGSAIGFLRAPYAFEATRSAYMRLDAFDASAARTILSDLAEEASAFVRSCDPQAEILTDAKLFMRYKGQGWEIPVPLDAGLTASPTADALHQRFTADYAALFGRAVEGLPIEITVWAVNAATPLAPSQPTPDALSTGEAQGAPRRLFDPVAGQWAEGATIPRDRLSDGIIAHGPLAVTESETTVIVPRGFTVTGRADGVLDIRRTS
jgi:N-methylhydantoinase A